MRKTPDVSNLRLKEKKSKRNKLTIHQTLSHHGFTINIKTNTGIDKLLFLPIDRSQIGGIRREWGGGRYERMKWACDFFQSLQSGRVYAPMWQNFNLDPTVGRLIRLHEIPVVPLDAM
ncbi:Hypothetical predicted protein [Olea europaea subsp. europaea]|uniref:Uncharacterized protein n=1 Tax=Olea europaea subsp. europaea TaxID=158383 RepID=A0A8S0SVF4_OLEEU|nr:Hypothetical predicted protein [Olea europaea subsp. europaea]